MCLPCCSSTASHKRVHLPLSADAESTGSLSLVFSRQTSGVIVSVDGHLVVENATLRRLHIDNVGEGYVELAIAADGVERQLRVWVDGGRTTSVPIGAAPMPPKQSPWASAGLSILALVISRSLSTWVF